MIAKCGNEYRGKTYPQFHGVACEMEHARDQRHGNATDPRLDGIFLRWWDEEQKKAVRFRIAGRST